MAEPRTLHCVKEAGQTTGIGLVMDNEDRASHVVLVAYVNENSIFHGQIAKDDEIVTVNGKSFKGDAKAASQAILEASELELLVRLPVTASFHWSFAFLDVCSPSHGVCALAGANSQADAGRSWLGRQKEGHVWLSGVGAPRRLARLASTCLRRGARSGSPSSSERAMRGRCQPFGTNKESPRGIGSFFLPCTVCARGFSLANFTSGNYLQRLCGAF